MKDYIGLYWGAGCAVDYVAIVWVHRGAVRGCTCTSSGHDQEVGEVNKAQIAALSCGS